MQACQQVYGGIISEFKLSSTQSTPDWVEPMPCVPSPQPSSDHHNHAHEDLTGNSLKYDSCKVYTRLTMQVKCRLDSTSEGDKLVSEMQTMQTSAALQVRVSGVSQQKEAGQVIREHNHFDSTASGHQPIHMWQAPSGRKV